MVGSIGAMAERGNIKYITLEQNNRIRAEIIRDIETKGTFGDRLWLPLLRFVHKREVRKERALYAPRR